MVDIAGGFVGFAQIKLWLYYISLFGVMLLAGLLIAGLVIWLLVQLKKKQVYEINMINRRIRIYAGREKKAHGGIKNFFARKLGRFIPLVQERYKWLKKNKEIIPLLKDNNGMLHTLKIPTLKEIKKWYAVQYNIDLNDKDLNNKIKEKQKNWDEIRAIYLLPNPHENLEWLGNQCVEADSEFKWQHWWQSPTVMIMGTAFICCIMFIVSMIVIKRM